MSRDTPAKWSRLEDRPLLIGAGRFVDDIRRPGLLAAAFLRSAHAHALIRRIDLSGARAHPGVHAAYTLDDLRPHLAKDRLAVALPSATIRQRLDRPVLADREVCHVGEPVAVVVAEDRYLAEDALERIAVEYDVLPPVVDCLAALQPGAARAHSSAPDNVVAEFALDFGDLKTAFVGAAHIFTETLRPSRGGSHSMECRGNVAEFDAATGQVTLWSSTQTPHAAMRLIAELLGRDEGSIRVIAPDVGGGFGPKLVFYQEDIVTVLASLLLKRPIKWIEDRREHFTATTQERRQHWELAMAVDGDGRIRGIKGSMVHDHGAYTARGVNVAFEAAQTLTMPYDIQACQLNVKLVATNLVPVTPVRGAGQPQGTFVMERLLDRIARELKLDRAEVRSRNLIRPEQLPYRKPYKTRGGVPVVIDSGDYPQCQAKTMAQAGWSDFPARQQAARQDGRHVGIGLANFVELTGRGPYEPAIVKINASGKIHVASSAAAMGQSTKTMLAQIVAAQLGGDIANVVVTTGDTAATLTGFGGFGSRQTVTAGSSAHVAAVKVRQKVLAVAGHLLECAPEDLAIERDEVRLKGARDLKVTLAQVAKASIGTAGAYLPGGLTPGLEASEQVILDAMTYSNGTAIATVEVDVETGAIKVLELVIGHDCGRVIDRTIVEGQLVGGIVHGLGNALLERMIFSTDGQPQTTTLADYLLPSADVVPKLGIVHLESPTSLNPLGVKGVGEAGVLPVAAAVISAVEDALRLFDVRITHAPVSPDEIFAVIATGRQSQA